jgi:serine/threonine protein kinase
MEVDDNEPAVPPPPLAPRREGHASVHPPAARAAPGAVARVGGSVRPPPSIRAVSSASLSVHSEMPATAAMGAVGGAPLSQRAPLLFICNDCWRTFSDGSLAACSCEKPRPQSGWAAMPYLFRGRYLFVELLGRGGMGAVFRAYDQAAHESPWVAVKVVQQAKPELAAMLKEMFQKEVAAAQMLAQHKQFFVQVLGHDGVDPAYLVLEHVPWQTLEEMLTSLPGSAEWLPPVQVARIGIAILRGVSKMHFHRIVHRDLTPSNIFIHRTPDGEGYDVKITDLGIWAFDQVQGDSESLTLAGRRPTIEGTPAYMSPEQSTGDSVGATSDIHTIGSLLWELATGVVPFPAAGDLPAHELVERRVESLRKIPKRPQGMPDGLYRVLAKALEFDRTDRWPSAVEMRKALETFVTQYHQQRQRDIEASFKHIERMSDQVSSLKEKLLPMRGLLERLGNLALVLREVRDHREECEPEALRGIAESTGNQLDEIKGELTALASWLEFVAGQTQRTAAARAQRHEDSSPASVPLRIDHEPWLERSPWVSVAIAAAFGLVLAIGYALGRPSSQPSSSSPPSKDTAAIATSSPPSLSPPSNPAAVAPSPSPAAASPAPAPSDQAKSGPTPTKSAAPTAPPPTKAAPANADPYDDVSPAPASSSTSASAASKKKPKPAPAATSDTSAAGSPDPGQRDLIRKNPYE